MPPVPPAPPTTPGYPGVSPVQDQPGYDVGTTSTPYYELWTQVPVASGAPKQSTVFWIAPVQGAEVTVQSVFRGTDARQTYQYQQALEANGFLTGGYSKGNWDADSREALRLAVWTANKNRKTLDEYLGTGLAFDQAESGGSRPEPYYGPSTTTQTSTNVNLSSRPTARAVLTGALQAELGREPTQGEVRAFLKSLNMAEEKNPTVSTTTTTSDPDPKTHNTEVTSSTTTEQSSVDPQQKAKNFAKQVDPQEAKRYQEGNYYDLLSRMLGV
jgi:hypothetical protein